VLAVLAGLLLLTAACSAGFVAGRLLPDGTGASLAVLPEIPGLKVSPDATVVDSSQGGTPQDLETLFKPFWQTWQLVHDEYVDQPVDEVAMMRGAIRGMLEALGDQHTSYMDPEQLQHANEQLSGEEYEGIGAWVDPRSEYLTIVSPMPGSPAAKAGLLPGDQIIAVDGEDMTGRDGETVRQKVIGPKGSTIILTILREGMDPFDVEVQRDSINVPTVESRMLDGNIAYIRLYTFGEPTTVELRRVLKELMDQSPSGLILDLRNNAGGYLDTAVDVGSEFVSDGVILYEEYGDGRRITFEAKKGGLATEIPMLVLINHGSASASEIVAGAIRDNGRGKLVGETSFGKGSVQAWTELVDNQGGVRVTIARWLTPSGATIHEKGLQPDVEIPFTEEDYTAGRDPQLDKAVELFTNGSVQP
jgi:carboxyl-terminal processing protease